MLKLLKKRSAFTLAEIFVSMVILSILVSVCIVFFSNRKDYEREYLYYAAYQNLVKAVDSALLDDNNLENNVTSIDKCGDDTFPLYQCRVFFSTGGTLCKVLASYFNIIGDANCTVYNSSPENGEKVSLKLTNGMEIYFNSQNPVLGPLHDEDGWQLETEAKNWLVWVDINGHGKGEDKKYYDIMPFYITRAGVVVPGYIYNSKDERGSEVEFVIRGYESPIVRGKYADAGANASLLAFDVAQYVSADSAEIKADPHAVSFAEAACKSGYVPEDTSYCQTLGYVKTDACKNVFADCKVVLIKKLKRNR